MEEKYAKKEEKVKKEYYKNKDRQKEWEELKKLSLEIKIDKKNKNEWIRWIYNRKINFRINKI